MFEFLLDAKIDRMSERDEDWREAEECPACGGPLVYRQEGTETVRFCCRCQEDFYAPGQLQRLIEGHRHRMAGRYVVLVTGGRRFRRRDVLTAALDKVHAARPIDVLVEGGADGADLLAREWADTRNIPTTITVRPQWNLYGKAAGVIRNAEMLREYTPNLVVAFPGGAGTADMVSRAHRAGTEVTVVVVP